MGKIESLGERLPRHPPVDEILTVHVRTEHCAFLCRSCAYRDAINQRLSCDPSWLSPTKAINPLAIGQFVNNHTRGECNSAAIPLESSGHNKSYIDTKNKQLAITVLQHIENGFPEMHDPMLPQWSRNKINIGWTNSRNWGGCLWDGDMH